MLVNEDEMATTYSPGILRELAERMTFSTFDNLPQCQGDYFYRGADLRVTRACPLGRVILSLDPEIMWNVSIRPVRSLLTFIPPETVDDYIELVSVMNDESNMSVEEISEALIKMADEIERQDGNEL